MRLSLQIFSAGCCFQREWTVLRKGTNRLLRFPAMCALLHHPTQGFVLFDTGYASRFMEATACFPLRLFRALIPVALSPQEELHAQFARSRIPAEEIKQVLLSHLHADHTAGLRDFPQAKIVASQAAHEQLKQTSSRWGWTQGLVPSLLPEEFSTRCTFYEGFPRVMLSRRYSPFCAAHDIFGDQSLLAISLPGHAAGHFGLLFEEADGREIFLIADACWQSISYQEARLPHPLSRLILHDWSAYCDTLKKLHALHLSHPELLMIPSHCARAVEQAARIYPPQGQVVLPRSCRTNDVGA